VRAARPSPAVRLAEWLRRMRVEIGMEVMRSFGKTEEKRYESTY
jgi:hypothetical protein